MVVNSGCVIEGRRRLFEPIEVAGLCLRNRTVMSPMTRHQARDGVLLPSSYYRKRAEGGVGLIITEGVAIDHPVADFMQDCPRIASSNERAAWKTVVEDVHAAGSPIVLQLWHTGIKRPVEKSFRPDLPSMSPSGHYIEREPASQPASDSEVADLVAAYGRTARAARDVGFDGVEVHGAHGYLVDQFFWDRTNSRIDQWGGSVDARVRFGTEVAREIKREAGADYPLFFRFSQWKLDAYDARLATTPDELAAILIPLAEAGVDLFDASTRRFWLPEFEGSPLTLAGWARSLTGKPSMAVGSIGLDGALEANVKIRGQKEDVAPPADLSALYERLARDEFDLVGLGRSILVNPEWVAMVRDGRMDEIKSYSAEAAAAALA